MFRVNEAASRPKRDHVPKRATTTIDYDKSPTSQPYNDNNFDLADTAGYSLSPAPPSYTATPNAGKWVTQSCFHSDWSTEFAPALIDC